MICRYADHNKDNRTGSVSCSGPVILTFHDGRGCVDVCFAHAQWRMSHSVAYGHGTNCKHIEARRA